MKTAAASSDVNKDFGLKAKAKAKVKDLSHKAKAKAKDLGPKAKANCPRPRTQNIKV